MLANVSYPDRSAKCEMSQMGANQPPSRCKRDALRDVRFWRFSSLGVVTAMGAIPSGVRARYERAKAAHRDQCNSADFDRLDLSRCNQFIELRSADSGQSTCFADAHADRRNWWLRHAISM